MAMTLVNRIQRGTIERIEYSWTSDGSGNQSQSIGFDGILMRAVTDPGTPAPTDNYSFSIIDEFGIDLLSGLGATNRDTANSEELFAGGTLSDGTNNSPLMRAHIGDVTLTIAGAGSAKQGKIILFVRR